MVAYRRILIKISGQSLAGPAEVGLDSDALNRIAEEILSAHRLGIQVAVVVGAGNIFRGNLAADWGIDRVEADNVGMLGTAINAVILRGVLTAMSEYDVRVMTGVMMNQVAEPFVRLRAIRHLEKGRIVIFAGGIGQPFVTTDYPAVQRALEIGADALLAGKNGVDGLYSADPRKDVLAELITEISYDQVIGRDLRVMDPAAFVLGREHGLPMHIFDICARGLIADICLGRSHGTYIRP